MELDDGRRAFVVPRAGEAADPSFRFALPTAEVVEPQNVSVLCEYTSAAVNAHPGCMDVQRFHHSGRPQMLAYGSGRAVVLAREINGDMRVCRTISGHNDTVTCVAWVASFKGPTHTQSKSLLLSASADGEIKLWEIDGRNYRQMPSLMAPASVISLHGCYLNASETSLLIAAASRDTVSAWRVRLGTTDTVTTAFTLSRTPDLCLTLRLVPLASLVLLFVGMTTGHLELWCLGKQETEESPVLAGSLKGHTDWLSCLDCQKAYPATGDADNGPSSEHVLVASGSQDNHIRVWYVQLREGGEQSPNEKGVALTLPGALSSTHRLVARLESVLAGHDNWVTGLAWHPAPWQPDAAAASAPPPRLLSASRDKSLVVWSPSQPVAASSATKPDELDMWLERSRFGHVGGNLLGFHGCAWGGYNHEVYGHGFNGDLSIWSVDGEERITLTGHFGAVTSLAWSRRTVDATPLNAPASSGGEDEEGIYPPYLLTASRDHTVRLHGLFYTVGSGCQPPVTMWRELARPQVHGYEMNALASIDAVRYVSAGDEKVGRVFAATRGFGERLLGGESFIASHPSLQTLSAGAVQPALGLSNRAAGCDGDGAEAEEEAPADSLGVGGYLDRLNPLYPPTETALSDSTLWTETNKLYGHSYEVYSLAVHPKEILIASACKASKEEFAKVFLWRTDTWQIHQQLPLHQLTVTAIRFDATGDRFVSVSRDRTWALSINTTSTGFPLYELFKKSPPGKGGHSRIIWACAWTPDNSAFLTASRDKRIMVWSTKTGARIGDPQTLSDPITAIDVGPSLVDTGSPASPSPFLVAVGYEFGGLELFSLSVGTTETTGAVISRSLMLLPADWSHMGLSVREVAFAPSTSKKDCVAMAACGDDGLVRIFRIFPKLLPSFSSQ